jgi:thymidylate kinase
MELQTDLFFNSAMYGYNVMCDATDTMFRINGNQSVDDIFNDILEIINGRI